jgi:hypothetical protein
LIDNWGYVRWQARRSTDADRVGHVAAVCLVAIYSRGIGRDRRDAQRRLFLQAWRLRQLLPNSP